MLRWLWRVLVGRSEPAAAPAAEPLEAQVVTLRARIQALESEWEDTLAKIQRWTARQNAYKRRAVAKVLEEPSESGSGEIVGPGATGEHAMSRKAQLRQLAYTRFGGMRP